MKACCMGQHTCACVCAGDFIETFSRRSYQLDLSILAAHLISGFLAPQMLLMVVQGSIEVRCCIALPVRVNLNTLGLLIRALQLTE